MKEIVNMIWEAPPLAIVIIGVILFLMVIGLLMD